MERTYIAIDLKSYYASVECADRGLDALTTNLVVADPSRTEKTICLAVSPSLKAYGIPGRARLFEVIQKVEEVNKIRKTQAPGREFTTSSHDATILAKNPSAKLEYIVAPPRMKRYMTVSTSIYNIYLRYLSPEDIHVYSIDECFMDVTEYLTLYKTTARELCMKMIHEVLAETGITATGGIGSNMFLCKVAMDIMAKKIPADKDGVRIAELDERTYREQFWAHEPITDFWRVGHGIANRLRELQIYTMGDIARCSIGLPPITDACDDEVIEIGSYGRVRKPDPYYNEDLLYKTFGVNAELLIDHAWGYEPTTIKKVKEYKPENNSISSGQVLSHPYEYEKAKIIVKEMTDLLVLDLVEKGLVTDQMVLTLNYEAVVKKNGKENDSKRTKKRPDGMRMVQRSEEKKSDEELTTDYYGRPTPKPAHGSVNLGKFSSSTTLIMDKMMELFESIADPELMVRRVTVVASHVVPEAEAEENSGYEQMDIFTDYAKLEQQRKEQKQADEKEKNLQKAMLSVKKKFGKNAILKGTNLMEGATTIERNEQVGGHKG